MKFFNKFGLMAMALCASAFMLTACSDDDNNGGGEGGGGGNGENAAPSITDKDGNSVQVTELNGISFNYDADGKLISFGNGYETYSFNKGVLTVSDGDGMTMKLTLNGNGVISQIKMTENYDDEKSDLTINYSYNSSMQLTGASVEGSDSWDYDGEKGSSTTSGSVTNTWTNGNMVKSVWSGGETGEEDGHSFTYKETATYEYTYSSTENESKQFPYSLISIVGSDEDATGILGVVGLFGTGTTNLPTKRVCTRVEEEDGDKYTYTNSADISFELNENGTIKKETIDYETYYYGYSNETDQEDEVANGPAVASRATVEQAKSLMPAIKSLRKQLFKHSRK
ncbi:MAG: DUF4595 domain-containing protein [Prevotellaceae bacterium]|nr:DUF4595 domain-containing protein [Prevotellaceae bacterium]